MKEKIMIFLIGLLLGAVMATGAFYIYSKNNSNCSSNNTQINMGQPPEMGNGTQPPAKPDGDNSQPPEMPNNNNAENNN